MDVWKYRGMETTTIEEWKSRCIDVWKVVGCTQRVSKFLLRIKHLPTAVYINGSETDGT
jgi:hypothetical protein